MANTSDTWCFPPVLLRSLMTLKARDREREWKTEMHKYDHYLAS